MMINKLVQKVHASGYLPNQIKRPKKKPAVFTRNRNLSAVDTKKGKSRAFVARDGKPVNFAPVGAPRGKTLSNIARNIKNG